MAPLGTLIASMCMATLVPLAAAAPPTDMEPVPPVPPKWGQLAPVRNAECPSIAGKYALVPEVFEISRENLEGEFRGGKRTDFLVFRRLNRDPGLGGKNMRVLEKPIPADE